MDKIDHSGIEVRIVITSHGPEVEVLTARSTMTVSEFEAFAADAVALARTARAQLSAKTRLGNLPMRK
jgi:hypothetical protein